MEAVVRYLREHLAGLVLAFAALGFLLFGAELLLTGHVKGEQALAPAAAMLGFAAALGGRFARRARAVRFWLLVMAAVAAVGLAGVAQHLEPEEEGVRTAPAAPPPPLAPLGLSGLAVLEALALLARPEVEPPLTPR